MSNEITRIYKGADAEMLTAIAAIMEAAMENKDVLITKRTSWADPFLPNLQTGVKMVIQTYLGVDSAKSLRTATQVINAIHEQAISNLQEVKVQIKRDFRDDAVIRDELLNQLGFKEFFKAADNGNQAALVQLLFRFKKALTPALQEQLTAKGIDVATLATISGFSDVVHQANTSQEVSKSDRKTVTQEAVIAFNDIYKRVMDVAVIAANLFKADKALQARFSYNQFIKAQKGGTKTVKKPVTATTPEAVTVN